MAVSLSVDLVQGNLCTNQLTVMCTTRGERRSIGFWCHKACMKSKLIISCRIMHNLIKRVMSYFTDWLRGKNRWMDGLIHHYVYTCGSCNTVLTFNTCFTGTD